MGELDGRVAIVTGGGGGIGRATAALLAQRGAAVVVADIDRAAADAVVADIGDIGGGALAVQVDMAVEDEVRDLVAVTIDHFGGVDVLHNNAALTQVGPDTVLTEIDAEYWDRVMAVNVRGYALGVKHAVPSMVERGGGVVVHTASGAGLQGDVVRAAYGTSKAAVIGLSRYVATQYGRFGVRSVAIAPGLIATPAAARELTPEITELLIGHHLVGRIGQPVDIAELVAFLVSDRAAFITGTTIEIDGGFGAHNPTYRDTLRLLEGGTPG